MALVTFTDSQGVSWRVWNVARETLSSARSDYLGAEYRNGWLCFQPAGDGERRRLAHFPDDWAAMTPEQLEALCRSATPHTPRVERPITAELPRYEPRREEPGRVRRAG